ncbi:hypothetical protein N7535_002786 [Penicillium sp. DV-2018c]|nr:hypothetical protein N7461_001530 [Penicillium sp. DV-2018c]KAJ5575860.1 hypothetical protein N7535_002786 [Penicillium sp. DV-2018c]
MSSAIIYKDYGLRGTIHETQSTSAPTKLRRTMQELPTKVSCLGTLWSGFPANARLTVLRVPWCHESAPQAALFN